MLRLNQDAQMTVQLKERIIINKKIKDLSCVFALRTLRVLQKSTEAIEVLQRPNTVIGLCSSLGL